MCRAERNGGRNDRRKVAGVIDQCTLQALQSRVKCRHLVAQPGDLSVDLVVHGCPRALVVDGDRNHSTGASMGSAGVSA